MGTSTWQPWFLARRSLNPGEPRTVCLGTWGRASPGFRAQRTEVAHVWSRMPAEAPWLQRGPDSWKSAQVVDPGGVPRPARQHQYLGDTDPRGRKSAPVRDLEPHLHGARVDGRWRHRCLPSRCTRSACPRGLRGRRRAAAAGRGHQPAAECRARAVRPGLEQPGARQHRCPGTRVGPGGPQRPGCLRRAARPARWLPRAAIRGAPRADADAALPHGAGVPGAGCRAPGTPGGRLPQPRRRRHGGH